MRKTVAAFMLLISMNAPAQNNSYTISKDFKNDELVFNGSITFDDLNKEPTFDWMKTGRDEYHPDIKTTTFIGEHLKDYSMIVFLGTWCSDSQDMIPRFEKVLQTINYPEATITMYGVDRTKKTKNGENKKYKIKLVPTIILLRDGKEAGRITETVHKSIEADIAAIIKRDISRKG
jgi:thiol-disulfide isomerase/thioredoxin